MVHCEYMSHIIHERARDAENERKKKTLDNLHDPYIQLGACTEITPTALQQQQWHTHTHTHQTTYYPNTSTHTHIKTQHETKNMIAQKPHNKKSSNETSEHRRAHVVHRRTMHCLYTAHTLPQQKTLSRSSSCSCHPSAQQAGVACWPGTFAKCSRLDQ